MLRIKNAFKNKAKVAYLTAGDGGIDKSVADFNALIAGGVNLLEIGIAYSDPVADGPVIQAAMQRALKHGINVHASLEIVRQLRENNREIAMIIFTYYNPIQANLAEFLHEVKTAGADGILVVDLPYEEAGKFRHWCKIYDLAPITVVAPSTTRKRLETILSGLNSGFVYYACQKGTTGVKDELPADLPAHIQAIRSVSHLPIAVGFGISNSCMVKQILELADGCVVGSYLVNHLANGVSHEDLIRITRELYDVA